MREITKHRHEKINSLNNRVRIEAMEEPKPGNAKYEIFGYSHNQWQALAKVVFQNGPVFEEQNGNILDRGLNGLTNETLLAIVWDRLDTFQKGPLACEENKKAMKKIEETLKELHKRTEQRQKRGVEGKIVI